MMLSKRADSSGIDAQDGGGHRVAQVDGAGRIEAQAEHEPARVRDLDAALLGLVEAVDLAGLATGVQRAVGAGGDALGVIQPGGDDAKVPERRHAVPSSVGRGAWNTSTTIPSGSRRYSP